ncbi:MAG TPA: glutathione S-transferase family protein [Kofleriaceae bacterium]|nr:glutathione S-transferase family protein [Kofleriaceae bacterium]
MSFTLHYHPLSSYCMKVLIALYETETPFTPRLVDLSDPEQRAALCKLWPIGKFPVLRDDAADLTLAESTTIIEYLAQHHPGTTALIPSDPDRAREVRMFDRLFDLYVHNQMQKITGDKLRPADQRDPFGVAQAAAQIETAYTMVDDQVRASTWVMGESFTLADCAAAPALFYADKCVPLTARHAATRAYLGRLVARPSFARALAEAQPYFSLFPS